MPNDPTNWLDDNSGGNDHPGVAFTEPGATLAGVVDSTPRAVTTQYGDRLVVEVVAAAGTTAPKGTEGVDGPIEIGEAVSLWVKPGAMAAAIRDACKAAGVKGIAAGDTLVVRYTADGEKSKPGQNPPKLYAAKYVPAKPAASLDDLI